jgi:hypothetical protein
MAEMAIIHMVKSWFNKEYRKMRREQDKKFKARHKKLRADAKPLVDDLRKNGFKVKSVWDFINTVQATEKAVPVLLKHIKLDYHPKTLAGIARALSMPETYGDDEVWHILMDLYKKTEPSELIEKPECRGFKDGLAASLSTLCDEKRLAEIITLIKDETHMGSRVFFVDALKRFTDRDEVILLLKALQDDAELGEMANIVLKKKGNRYVRDQ